MLYFQYVHLQDPNLAGMGPQLRMMFANPQFQQMVSNPESLRQMFQTAAQMRAGGFDPANMGMGGLYPPFPLGGGLFGGGAGASGASTGTATSGGAGPGGPTNLFNQAAQGGGVTGATGAAAPNPFAALLGGGAGLGAQSPGGVGNAAAGGGGANPFGMVDPNLMSQLLGAPGGFGGFGGASGVPASPADSRPVEERFQVLEHSSFPLACDFNDFKRIGPTTATERHGIHERITECSRSPCHGWKRSRCHRIYSGWEWIIEQPFVHIMVCLFLLSF